MSDQTSGLGHEYVAALDAYLKSANEATLSRAYELGRRAMTDGLGVLDMATLHRAAVDLLLVSGPRDHSRFAKAADFFNELLSPFEMSFRGYRGANESLQRLNETLRRQKEEVEIVNRELETFSYSVTHDLRSPLQSIFGFSEILYLDFGAVLGDEGKETVQDIRSAAQHMSMIIDALLSLSHVTRAEMEHVEVDLSKIARGIAGRLKATAPTRNGTIDIEEGLRGQGDPRLLSVLLENLLGNAWKFTSKRNPGLVTFGFEDREGTPTFFIRDNGAGFDMTYAPKLFRAFERLHSGHDFQGNGIGLATVRRVVDRHGGRVWAEGAVDRGATFYFTLRGGGRAL